ncbi:ClpXP protease specificity-enhancing factor [Hydrogenovibrio marinus]|uniref:Peptidase n=1 Tax=Hydrogenovibrio marinus TaxID=28885 RepID=A0A066ZTA5_HYDMR|nr:ClpXP protease specificity-enhancing factor [Hydrogenovibrio marinus]KDN96682.1 peptidase [Hydrogenovibrio marinus]BBN58918.1 stringent starvation protein B [Hydrogenovibrio marinus]
MISNRPYLIRAMFQWIVDNHWTPHVQVDVNYPGVVVPQQYVQEGMIVLNIHPDAVRELQMDNHLFRFKARFQGVEQQIFFSPDAVLAIFARENGQGMPFPPEAYPEETEDNAVEDVSEMTESNAVDKPKKASKKPHLTIVK